MPLISTGGDAVDLSRLEGRTVVYSYPRTGDPIIGSPAGWNEVPGARGCTPQSLGFRDHLAEITALGARVFGLSTQATAYQREAKERLDLPFDLLSDEQRRLATAMHLPTFEFDDLVLLKRLTLVLANGEVEKVFYPVFPPDENAAAVVDWLSTHAQGRH